MKLKDSDKALLLVLFSIAVVVFSGIYIVKPNFDKKKAFETESVQLRQRLSDLQAKEAHREEYEAGIVEFGEKFQEVLNHFPADLNQEVTIMFLKQIKDTNEFIIDSLGLGAKEAFYTLGMNDATLTPVSNAGTEAATTEAATTEAATTEAVTTEAAASTGLVEGTPEPTEDTLTCFKAAFPMEYHGSYRSLKDVVDYIDHYSDRMTVDSITISLDEENIYAGDIKLSCYSVEGASRPERQLEINQVEIGVDNIFIGNENAASSSNSLNKYDENDGAAIETAYDFYAMLNAATSDVSAKVLGQNGTGKENTVISNSDNTSSTVTYDFYTVDGKNYCKYTLDGTQSYEAEVTSAEDVKLLIQSSERKNDEDKVDVKIVINNNSTLPVYVKVNNDDAVSPRVSITKTGLVKVYQ